MNKITVPNFFKDTPTILVVDNRGQAIRAVQYNRDATTLQLDCLISRSTYSPLGQLRTSADPRFFDMNATNLSQVSSLSGQSLRVDSVDAGWRLALLDIEGAPHKEWDELGTTRRYDYDVHLHRPITVYTQRDDINSGVEQITERFVYGYGSDADTNRNLQLIGHYDHAGLAETISVSLTGQPLIAHRQLMRSKTDDSDWQGANDTQWQVYLEPTRYITQWSYNALGMMLTQLDAKGNRQRSEYDVSGTLSASYLLLTGQDEGAEQTLVSGIEYNANGQKTYELAGNGVVTAYTYDERDWRLQRVLTQRPAKTGRSILLLQDLNYSYDPVGNITLIENKTQAIRFYKNQRVVPEQGYTYDALYQLILATGRENDNPPNSNQHSSLPPLNDTYQYKAYYRQYRYDRGGNLCTIQHVGASQYTLEMQVSNRSNRTIQQTPATILADGVDEYFDAHGNLQQLEHSKALTWGRYDQLKQVDLTDTQQEVYQYTNPGARIRKVLSDSSVSREQEVIYLPGIELRVTRHNQGVSEELHQLSLNNTGRSKVQLLHWEEGVPVAIVNDQLRYSLDNHLGSSNLELDQNAEILTMEEYYPFGGTAMWLAKNDTEAKYKTIRYSGKERDATGLYYYGYRYYMPWMGRWLNPDPGWTVDGLNLYRMVGNNPVTFSDLDGLIKTGAEARAQVGEAFVHPLHMSAFEQISKDKSIAMSVRESGVFTINALGEGAAAKGHNILEKTIKPGSLKAAYGSKADDILKQAKSSGFVGRVGKWVKGEVKGIYANHTTDKEDRSYNISLENLQENELVNAWIKRGIIKPYTGDYDMHDIIHFSGGKGVVPTSNSPEELGVKDMINRAVAVSDPNRSFDDIPMNVIRHGPQVNFVPYMWEHERGDVIKNDGYLGVVAKQGAFPIAMVHQGDWTIIENSDELSDFYTQNNTPLPKHWAEEFVDRGRGYVATPEHAKQLDRMKRAA